MTLPLYVRNIKGNKKKERLRLQKLIEFKASYWDDLIIRSLKNIAFNGSWMEDVKSVVLFLSLLNFTLFIPKL